MSEPETRSTLPEEQRAGTGGSALPAWLRRVGLPAFRVVAVLLILNAACGLAARLHPGAGPADLGEALLRGSMVRLLLYPHGPGHLSALWTQAAPLTAVVFLAGMGVLLGIALSMRPGAVLGLFLAFLLLLLTLKASGAHLWRDVQEARYPLLAAAFLTYGLVIFITVVRWGILLDVQGVHLPLTTRARLTLIGVFFNLAIPGAVGGDLIKMACVAGQAKDRKAEAMLTIFLDRIIGILGLFVVASVAVAGTLPTILAMDNRFRPLQGGAMLVGLGSLGGIVGVLLVEFRAVLVRHAWIAWLLQRAQRCLPAGLTAMIQRLVDAIELYRDRRGAVLRAGALAVAVHVLLAVTLFLVGRAVGEHGLKPRHYVVTASVANAVAAIPLTPGGLGTRDATTAAFFTAFGAEPPDRVGSIPVILSLIIMIWALVGAAIFVCTPPRSEPHHRV